jgi:hypothetical protein
MSSAVWAGPMTAATPGEASAALASKPVIRTCG